MLLHYLVKQETGKLHLFTYMLQVVLPTNIQNTQKHHVVTAVKTRPYRLFAEHSTAGRQHSILQYVNLVCNKSGMVSVSVMGFVLHQAQSDRPSWTVLLRYLTISTHARCC